MKPLPFDTEIQHIITVVNNSEFKSKLDAYIEATKKNSQKVYDYYMVYSKVIEYLHRISEGILLKYPDEMFMKILKVLIGAPNETTEEVYKELVYRRFMLKGKPLSTTAEYYDFIYHNMNL